MKGDTMNTRFFSRILPWVLLPTFSFASSDLSVGGIQVGKASYIVPCPYGSIPDPAEAPLELRGASANEVGLRLQKDLISLVFQADCKKKVIDVSNGDRSLFESWEAMPDGSFSFWLPKMPIGFQRVNQASLSCQSDWVIGVSGFMDCSQRDEPIIHLELWGNLGQHQGNPEGCQFPEGAYLYSEITVKQCKG